MNRTLQGGCHCGRVRFSMALPDAPVALDCNCSICQKKGFLHVIVPPEQFVLLSGADALAEYRFGTNTAIHRFCRHCGVHPFYTPRSHPDQVDVNARCLDGDGMCLFRVVPYDGRSWAT